MLGIIFIFLKNGIVGISRLTPESTDRDAEMLAYLKQGDILAEHNLMPENQYPASATATALSEVELLSIRRQEFLELLIEYEDIALELARMLSGRLVDINTRLSSKGAETKISLSLWV